MKKALKRNSLFCLMALVLSITFSSVAFAEDKKMAPWWGTYYNEENGVTINIFNVDVKYHLNPEGVAMFTAIFEDKDENELCDAMGVFEEIDAYRVPVMYYGFTMNKKNDAITVDAYDDDFKEQDGCTKAYFGTYTRKE